jgi:hypothetical protein
LQVGALVLDLSFCRVGVLTRPLRQPLSTFNYLLPSTAAFNAAGQ